MSERFVQALRVELAETMARAAALANMLRDYAGSDDLDVQAFDAEVHASKTISIPQFLPQQRQKRGLPPGVTLDGKGNRFRARPYGPGSKRNNLGSYRSVEDAAAAIDRWKQEQQNTSGQKGAAEPTTPSQQPEGRRPGAETAPIADAPARGLKRDACLDLYASTDLNQRQIAARLGLPCTSPGAFIHLGRKAGDERVRVGDARRGRVRDEEHDGDAQRPDVEESGAPNPELPASDGVKGEAPASLPTLGVSSLTAGPPSPEAPALSGGNRTRAAKVIDVPDDRLVPRYEREEKLLPRSGAAREKTIAEVVSAHAPVKRPALGNLQLVPVGPIAIDETANVVAGPKGEWQTHHPCILILKRLAMLAPGSMLDAAALSTGGMSRVHILESVGTWTRELADIGIELGRMGELFWLKRIEREAA